MPALVFDTCCGCIDLRTGSLIIGYLQLVAEIIVAIMLLVALAVGGALVGGAVKTDNREDAALVEASGAALLVIAVIMLLALILAFAFTITLLVGVHKNKRGHVKAYMIYATIFLVLSLILFFVSLSKTVTAQSIGTNICNFIISGYFLLVIRSYYYKMDENKPAVFNSA